MADKTILHCDANNFYASVECAKNPALKGYPIAVCGNPEKRHGIVLAKSPEAKRLGVATGETIWQAKAKCKDLLIVPPDYSAYIEYSNALFAIYNSYTDRVESFGLDECWLDVTGSKRLFGDGFTIAETLRKRIKSELKITVSIGVSFSKIFAKLGSDYKKPDATTVISRENYKETAWQLQVGEMMSVGKKTAASLSKCGIRTIGDLATANMILLKEKFGIIGEKLIAYANGEDGSEVAEAVTKTIPESVGNGLTSAKDMVSSVDAETLIVALSEVVATRLRKYRLKANGVHLAIKDNTLSTTGKQIKTQDPIGSAGELIRYGKLLLKGLWNEKTGLPLRAITITAINLIGDNEEYQPNFFENNLEKQEKIEKSVDEIRSKYGFDIIKRGSLLTDTYATDKKVENFDFTPFKKN